MSKKMKLTLDKLNISSFVTDLEKDEIKRAKGGETEGGDLCNTLLTCNSKCGYTEYWECGQTEQCTSGGTCTWPKCY